MPVKYKNVRISCGYRLDLLIKNQLIVELKCVDKIHPISLRDLRALRGYEYFGCGFAAL
ncbi:MAG: GxxExxY protein [Nitrospinota bacterium]